MSPYPYSPISRGRHSGNNQDSVFRFFLIQEYSDFVVNSGNAQGRKSVAENDTASRFFLFLL
ncbi:hypothetical protein [Niabella sp.]|uniref:hypothetical protein n=1 Tax=Niabella sp. TaxID=1962976 RepID=UPI002619E65C|nr:hypothetical protein [Niabella sp.]